MVNLEKNRFDDNDGLSPNDFSERFKLIRGITNLERTDGDLISDSEIDDEVVITKKVKDMSHEEYYNRVDRIRQIHNQRLSPKSSDKGITIEKAFALAESAFGKPEGFSLAEYLNAHDVSGGGDR